MQIKFISIRRLKIHETDATLRNLHPNEQQWTSKSEIFGEIERKAIKSFITLVGQLLAAYLIVSSLRDGNQISIRYQDIEASVPAAYFFLFISYLLFALSISFNHLSTAAILKANLAAKN